MPGVYPPQGPGGWWKRLFPTVNPATLICPVPTVSCTTTVGLVGGTVEAIPLVIAPAMIPAIGMDIVVTAVDVIDAALRFDNTIGAPFWADDTVNAQSAGVDDMSLAPAAVQAATDAYLFGCLTAYDGLILTQGRACTALEPFHITAYFSTGGGGWIDLTPYITHDEIGDDWANDGILRVMWNKAAVIAAGWAVDDPGGLVGNHFWIKYELTTITLPDVTWVSPQGTQAFQLVYP